VNRRCASRPALPSYRSAVHKSHTRRPRVSQKVSKTRSSHCCRARNNLAGEEEKRKGCFLSSGLVPSIQSITFILTGCVSGEAQKPVTVLRGIEFVERPINKSTDE
jgi:hypothetical protein